MFQIPGRGSTNSGWCIFKRVRFFNQFGVLKKCRVFFSKWLYKPATIVYQLVPGFRFGIYCRREKPFEPTKMGADGILFKPKGLNEPFEKQWIFWSKMAPTLRVETKRRVFDVDVLQKTWTGAPCQPLVVKTHVGKTTQKWYLLSDGTWWKKGRLGLPDLELTQLVMLTTVKQDFPPSSIKVLIPFWGFWWSASVPGDLVITVSWNDQTASQVRPMGGKCVGKSTNGWCFRSFFSGERMKMFDIPTTYCYFFLALPNRISWLWTLDWNAMGNLLQANCFGQSYGMDHLNSLNGAERSLPTVRKCEMRQMVNQMISFIFIYDSKKWDSNGFFEPFLFEPTLFQNANAQAIPEGKEETRLATEEARTGRPKVKFEVNCSGWFLCLDVFV